MNIQMIVGLGNPGNEYDETRHNAGFWFVDYLAQQHQGQFRKENKFFGDVCKVNIAGKKCWLLKPSTFMNRSGQSVSALANYYKISPLNILVAHDELDLVPGVARLKKGGGHAGHNGLRDIISALDSREFLRLRIGVDHPGSKKQVVDYVLGRPSRDHREAIDDAMGKAATVMPRLMAGELQPAMHELHSG